ncbi:MAG: hypothetical protein WCE68_02205 [Anaerolineales bacterium]
MDVQILFRNAANLMRVFIQEFTFSPVLFLYRTSGKIERGLERIMQMCTGFFGFIRKNRPHQRYPRSFFSLSA